MNEKKYKNIKFYICIMALVKEERDEKGGGGGEHFYYPCLLM